MAGHIEIGGSCDLKTQTIPAIRETKLAPDFRADYLSYARR